MIYPGATVRLSAVFTLERESLGAFKYELEVPDDRESEGEWTYRWVGEGDDEGIGVIEGKFRVKATAFDPC